MSIWRAPLLVLGILVILLAAGALAAPWLIDFNRYKPQLEQWASSLTGRKVRIGGDVDVVLFPWPAVRLRDVTVSGVPEGRFSNLLEAPEVYARFSLAALFAARLEVEDVVLRQPVLQLEHLGQGRGNWQMALQAPPRLPLKPERVAIDAVRIEQGRIVLADHRLRNVLRLDEVHGRLQARSLNGPWRMDGGWKLLGRPWKVRLSTGVLQAGQSVSLSLRMDPANDAPGYTVRLEAMLERERAAGEGGVATLPRLRGKLQLLPVIPAGRSDPLDPARQVEVSSDVLVSPDVVELPGLKIISRFPKAGPFEELTGDVRLEMGRVMDASISLSTRRLALNGALRRLLGEIAQKRKVAGSGDGLDALRWHLRGLAAKLPQMPPELLLELDLKVDELLLAGRMLHGVALSAEATTELLSIRHLRADVPGRGALSFRGNLLAGDLLQLTGELDVRAPDARALLAGLLPGGGRALRVLWRGRGGKLALLATMDMTDHAVRLVSRRMALDDAPLRLDWRLLDASGAADGRKLSLRLQTERLDADRYLGIASPREALERLGSALRQWLLAERKGRLQLELEATTLNLAAMQWKQVALALERREKKLSLRRLRVGEVEGLALEASGDFLEARGQAGWQGSLNGRLRSREGERALGMLKRLVPGMDTDLAPLRALARAGLVDVALRLKAGVAETEKAGAKPGNGPWLEAMLHGRAGDARLSFSARGQVQPKGGHATGKGWPDWRQANWHVQGELDAVPAATLLTVLGLQEGLAAEGQGGLKVSLTGVPVREMRGQGNIHLPGLEVQASGNVALARNNGVASAAGKGLLASLRGDVRLSLRVEDARAWRRKMRLVLPLPLSDRLEGSLQWAFSPRHWRFSGMALQMRDNRLAGDLVMVWPEEVDAATGMIQAPRLEGEVVMDRLDPLLVLRAILEEGDGPRLRARIADGWRLGVLLRAREVLLPWRGLVLARGKMLLRQDSNDPDALMVGVSAGRRSLKLEMNARLMRKRRGVAVKGIIRGLLPLERIVRSEDGTVRLAGRGKLTLHFEGQPVSLRGALLALKGSGKLELSGARLEGLAPDRLMAVVRSIGTQAELERFDELVDAALRGGEWPLPEQVETGLLLSGGLLELMPLAWEHAGVRTRLSGMVEVASGRMDITLDVHGKGEEADASFSLNLSGEAGGLAFSVDTALLREWAQRRVIRRKEEELKRLEQERVRLQEQARKMEEAARQQEAERRKQQALHQQAEKLHEQLQQVLSRAYRQMQDATVERETGTGQDGAATSPPLSIEDLLRQAQEDAAAEQAATRRGNAVRPGSITLPKDAQALPRVVAPRPRARPSHGAVRRVERRAAPRGRKARAAVGVAGSARKRGTSRPRDAARERRREPIVEQGGQKEAAVRNGKAARAGGQQAQEKAVAVPRPLTNWNRLAP